MKQPYGFILGMAALSLAVFNACSSGDEEWKGTKTPLTPIALTEETRAVASELRDFYFDFSTDVMKYNDANGRGSENVIVSPLSATMVLAMAANGLDEVGAKAYTDYLGCEDLDNLNSLCSVLLSELPKADGMVNLALANSIWVNDAKNITLTQDYSSVISSKFSADMLTRNFETANNATVREMNNWCSAKTKGMIPNFMEELSTDNLAVLFNALYFNGMWEEDLFKPENTVSGTFHGKDGDSNVEMMYTYKEASRYSNYDGFEWFNLPFGNYAYKMTILLPSSDMSIEDATKMVSNTFLENLKNNDVGDCDLSVSFPKFSVEGKNNLSEMLTGTGHGNLVSGLDMTMFSPTQSGDILYTQGVSLRVSEKGVEAAAVTEGDLMNTVVKRPSYKVKVDRPFFFFITEYSTGAMILSGRIVNI